MKMASLSIYKSILNRTVPGALYRLLWASDAQAFLRSWGELFAALCERGYEEKDVYKRQGIGSDTADASVRRETGE